MPYTDAQIERITRQPGNIPEYKTITFFNSVAGYKRLLVANESGPYFPKTLGGNSYQPVACSVPDVSNQSNDATTLGKLQFGRIGSQVRAYIKAINQGAKIPNDAVIQINISKWSGDDVSAPINTYDMYASKDGIAVDQDNATITLAVDNPGKISFVFFYDLTNYPGLTQG